jgi:hypothetical protein
MYNTCDLHVRAGSLRALSPMLGGLAKAVLTFRAQPETPTLPVQSVVHSRRLPI